MVAVASGGHVPFPTMMVRRVGLRGVGYGDGLILTRRDDVVWGGMKRSDVEPVRI